VNMSCTVEFEPPHTLHVKLRPAACSPCVPDFMLRVSGLQAATAAVAELPVDARQAECDSCLRAFRRSRELIDVIALLHTNDAIPRVPCKEGCKLPCCREHQT
jgi:hypothetical protein